MHQILFFSITDVCCIYHQYANDDDDVLGVRLGPKSIKMLIDISCNFWHFLSISEKQLPRVRLSLGTSSMTFLLCDREIESFLHDNILKLYTIY